MPAARRPDSRARARLYQLGALIVTAAAVTAVLVAVLTAGSTSQLAPGKPVPAAAQTLALFAGIPQHGIALGDPRAPVTLVEFGDLQCPACAQVATDTLPAIVSRYVRSGRAALEFRALDFIGADSRRAASMALALAEQGRLWQFIELAYHNQGLENSGYVSEEFLRTLATQVPGLNMTSWLAARSNPEFATQITTDAQAANNAGFTGTPSFQIGRTGGALKKFEYESLTDPAAFEKAIESLAKA